MLHPAGRTVESNPVPSAVIESVMLDVSRLLPAEVESGFAKMKESHRTLMHCVIQFCEFLPEDAFKSAIISTFVVMRAFEIHYGREVREIDSAQIARHIERNGISYLEKRSIEPGIPDQPFALKFMAEVIADIDPSKKRAMTDFQRFSLFVTLKTVVHVLSEAYCGSPVSDRSALAVSG